MAAPKCLRDLPARVSLSFVYHQLAAPSVGERPQGSTEGRISPAPAGWLIALCHSNRGGKFTVTQTASVITQVSIPFPWQRKRFCSATTTTNKKTSLLWADTNRRLPVALSVTSILFQKPQVHETSKREYLTNFATVPQGNQPNINNARRAGTTKRRCKQQKQNRTELRPHCQGGGGDRIKAPLPRG